MTLTPVETPGVPAITAVELLPLLGTTQTLVVPTPLEVTGLATRTATGLHRLTLTVACGVQPAAVAAVAFEATARALALPFGVVVGVVVLAVTMAAGEVM